MKLTLTPHPRTPLAAVAAASILASPMVALAEAGQHHPTPSSSDSKLQLEQLVELALRNNPELLELKGDLYVAIARERAAGDWEDPELRLDFSREHDVELPRPESETRTVTRNRNGSTSTDESLVRTDQTTGRAPETERRSTDGSGSFSETTTATTTRRIEYGPRSERITQETRESSSAAFSESETTSIIGPGGETSTRIDRLSGTSSGRLTDREVETRRFNSDITAPDEDFEVSVRLRFPNPLEQKARVNRARARVGLATAMLRAAEHEITLAVRERYADLVASQQELETFTGISNVQDRLADEIDGLGNWAKLDDIIDKKGDSFRAKLELRKLHLEFQRDRAQLARLVGLADPSRIGLETKLVPRWLDLENIDRQFLYQVADGMRSDLLELVHGAAMSGFELAEYNARRIPWFTFIEGFYGVDYDRGDRSSDNYGVQVGVSVPLFTLFRNKEHEIYEQEQRSLNRQADAVRRQIRAEIDVALDQLEEATSIVQGFENERAKFRKAMGESLKTAQQGGAASADARFRAEETLAELDEEAPAVYQLYNEAVLTLERAIGASLENVFVNDSHRQPHDQPTGHTTGAAGSAAAATPQDPTAPAGESNPPEDDKPSLGDRLRSLFGGRNDGAATPVRSPRPHRR